MEEVVRGVQALLLAIPVLLALCATVGVGSRWMRWSFGLSRRALCLFRVSLGVAALLDIAHRAGEVGVWLTDDGVFGRTRKLQLCLEERPGWALVDHYGGRACEWSLHMMSGTWRGQSLLLALQALLALLLIVGVRHSQACAFALFLMTDSLHNFVRLSHGGVGPGFLNFALFWAWQLPLTRTGASRGGDEAFYSPATVGFVLCTCIIYWDCVVARIDSPDRSAWLDGTALARAMLLSRYRTSRGLAMTQLVPAWVLRLGTRAALVAEAVSPFFLLIPRLRAAAVAILASIFIGIFMFMALGVDTLLCAVTFFPFLCSGGAVARGGVPAVDGEGNEEGRTEEAGEGTCDGAGAMAARLARCGMGLLATCAMWIAVGTHVCTSSAMLGDNEACRAARPWLAEAWASPLTHGPWQMFAGIESYQDWRLLQLVSNSTASDAAPDCAKNGNSTKACIFGVRGLRSVVDEHRVGTLQEHVLWTDEVPVRDSFRSFWWQDFWETSFFLDGGMEEAYYMSAAFYCRTTPGARRYYLLAMVHQDHMGDPAAWTSRFDLYTCPCGNCGKQGDHTVFALGDQPFSALNGFLAQHLPSSAETCRATVDNPSTTTAAAATAEQRAAPPLPPQTSQPTVAAAPLPPALCCSVDVHIGPVSVVAKVDPDSGESTKDAILRFANDQGITAASHGDGALVPVYQRLEQLRISARPRERTFVAVENDGQGRVVADHLSLQHGLREVFDLGLEGIFFKWITWPRQVDFRLFREGRDLVNTIGGIAQLDRKDFMQSNMEAYAESGACRNLLPSGQARCLRPVAFFPATYALSTERGCRAWARDAAERPQVDWLVKPPDTFAGDGLRFVDPGKASRVAAGASCEILMDPAAAVAAAATNPNHYDIYGLPPDNTTWVQEYIANPALSNGTKHSLRSYALILSVEPLVVLYHEGMAYRSLVPYAPHAADRTWSQSPTATGMARLAHITNIQSNHPDWGRRKAEGLLSWQQFAESLDPSLSGVRFARGRLQRQAAAITSFVIRSCKHGLQHRNGSFELMAVDFTVDATGRLWLHEFNVAPAIDSGGPSFAPKWKREVQYDMARDALDLVLETFRLQTTAASATPTAGTTAPSLISALRPQIQRTKWQVAYAENAIGHVEEDAVAALLPHEADLLAVGGRSGSATNVDTLQKVAAYGDFLNLVSRQVAIPAVLLESHVPQGMEWLSTGEGEAGFLLSMYSRKDSSAILVFLGEAGRTSRYILSNENGTPFRSHAGGIALVGGLVWVCNEGVHGARHTIGELVAFRLPRQQQQQQQQQAGGGGAPLRALRRVAVDSRASFVSTSKSQQDVCIGEFAFQGRAAYPIAPHHLVAGAGNTAWISCYGAEQLLSGSAAPLATVNVDGVAVPRPTKVYLTGDGIQGVANGDGEFVVLSIAFGPGDSMLQYHDLALHGTPLALAVPPSQTATAAATVTLAYSLSGATLANKVFMPALSQDLAFVRHSPLGGHTSGALELAIAFESATSAHRDMVDVLGWSAKDSRAHVLRLPKWRSRVMREHFPNVTAIGHHPVATALGSSGLAVAADMRAVIRIEIDGRERVLRFERGLSRAEAMSEGRWFCAWNDIRDANCPRGIATAIQNER
jgi:hypothetical protein